MKKEVIKDWTSQAIPSSPYSGTTVVVVIENGFLCNDDRHCEAVPSSDICSFVPDKNTIIKG